MRTHDLQRRTCHPLSLKDMAHDMVLVDEGLILPTDLDERCRVCRCCKGKRNVNFITQYGYCLDAWCQQVFHVLEDIKMLKMTKMLKTFDIQKGGCGLPGDCIVDPCKPMHCIHCDLKWGCRRRCGREGGSTCGLMPCFHSTLLPSDDSHAVDFKCFAQCSNCRQCICYAFADEKGCWWGDNETDNVSQYTDDDVYFRFDRRVHVISKGTIDLFGERRKAEFKWADVDGFTCPVCEWMDILNWEDHCNRHWCDGCHCLDGTNRYCTEANCWEDLLETTLSALECVNHPDIDIVRNNWVVLHARIKKQLV